MKAKQPMGPPPVAAGSTHARMRGIVLCPAVGEERQRLLLEREEAEARTAAIVSTVLL